MLINKITLILILVSTLIYAFQFYYPNFIITYTNISLPLVSGAAVVVAFSTLLKYWHRIKERFSFIWLLLACGLLLWFMGETAWAIYPLILNIETPYISIADAFWLSAYFPILAALYLYVDTFKSVLSRKTTFCSLVITILLAALITWILVTPVVANENNLIYMIVELAYPILDVTLLSVGVLGLIIFFEGKLAKYWAFINAGFILDMIADVLYCYTAAQDTYYDGHPLNLLYIIAYLFYILAFYTHTKEL